MFDFPNSPTVGQVYPSSGLPQWMWDGQVWKGAGGNMVPVYISDTAPPAPVPDRAFWWKSDVGVLYIRYNDGNSVQWVVATPINSSSIGDAPSDNNSYMRSNGAWVSGGNINSLLTPKAGIAGDIVDTYVPAGCIGEIALLNANGSLHLSSNTDVAFNGSVPAGDWDCVLNWTVNISSLSPAQPGPMNYAGYFRAMFGGTSGSEGFTQVGQVNFSKPVAAFYNTTGITYIPTWTNTSVFQFYQTAPSTPWFSFSGTMNGWNYSNGSDFATATWTASLFCRRAR